MTEDAKVTPWEVSGNLGDTDYSKIADRFGAKIIDAAMKERIAKYTGDLHPFLRYDVFFAHRDLDTILDAYSRGDGFYLYTGRGPSGKMHLGHLLPFMFTKWLQEKFNVDLIVQITDDEKFLFRDLNSGDLAKYTNDNILDILSLGFNPERTHIMVDTLNSGLLYNNAIKVARHINVSLAKSVFGFDDSDNVGKYFFTSMQAVPSFILSEILGRTIRCLIPYAIDQDPHFKVARDVMPKIGYEKPSSIISKFIPSLKGSGKMSSSDTTTGIYLDDDRKTVRKKLMKYAFSGGRDTAEEQRKYGANPNIDFSFNVFRLLENDPSVVSRIYEEYRSGQLLSGEMKAMTADRISNLLEELRVNREKVKDSIADYMFSPDRFR